MDVQRKSKARSRDYCCHGKAISVTYCETERERERDRMCVCVCVCVCVCSLTYPACNAHAPYCTLTCGLPRCTVSVHITSQKARVSESVFEQKIVLWFWFPLHLLSEKCLIIKRIRRDTAMNVQSCSSCRNWSFLSDFDET